MYIIVVGGGEVGYHLSKILLNEGHEVLILEQDAARCERLTEEFGAIVYRGDGCEAATLDSVGTGRADMLVAVTDGDEDNLVSCQVAKHRFNVPRTIARITNPKNETIFRLLGIDATVSSTNLILAHIEQELPSHPLIPLLKLKSGTLEVVEVKIPEGSRVVGKKIGDFRMPEGSAVLLVVGKEKGPFIPTNDTVLEAEDDVVAITSSDNEEAMRAMLVGKQSPA
ncbi:MAG: NAD-binding protein [Dehalococcoidia bacterium]|nr:MAG: NAD-binding protein [Dehalococcoidia bacterium]